MGILRTDKISGLETPTPVTGSVAFDGSDYLAVTPTDQFEFGGTDFTIEMWVNITSTSGMVVTTFFSKGNNGSVSTEFMSLQTTGNNTIPAFFFRSGSALVSGPSLELSKWYHLAVTRSGNTFRLFVDGKLVDSATNSNDLTTGVTGGVSVSGQSYDLTANNRKFIGSLSNVRILKGTALYTSDFTVPTHALEVIGDTVLLCCNNPDSVGADGTGKTITASGDPTVSTDNPSLTRDFTSGTEFRGVTTFDTQGYFVPPSGTTEQRYINVASNAVSAARGLFAGGYSYGNPAGSRPTSNVIDYVTISSTGDALDFGDLTESRGPSGGVASPTRGVWIDGDKTASPHRTDTIDYVTIASTGNATDFGNTTGSHGHGSGNVSDSTRGICGGGNPGPQNNIEYITIASTGNGQDFGDLTVARYGMTAVSSPTRGVFSAGDKGPAMSNTMDYITIQSMGNALDFGDGIRNTSGIGAASNSIRGLFANGFISPYQKIDYITIASTGNAIEFGDMGTDNSRFKTGTSSPTRAVFAGGYGPSPAYSGRNDIEYVTIMSLGNAVDFGNLTSGRGMAGGCSNGHGGLG
jgi:hypothetical protein